MLKSKINYKDRVFQCNYSLPLVFVCIVIHRKQDKVSVFEIVTVRLLRVSLRLLQSSLKVDCLQKLLKLKRGWLGKWLGMDYILRQCDAQLRLQNLLQSCIHWSSLCSIRRFHGGHFGLLCLERVCINLKSSKRSGEENFGVSYFPLWCYWQLLIPLIYWELVLRKKFTK